MYDKDFCNTMAQKTKGTILISALIGVGSLLVFAVVPTTLEDFFLAGSQPGDSGNLEKPGRCANCHGGYDLDVEPTFNWSGSMMAQAARDPLFYACMAVSLQDVPESGDLCIRCHSPGGWLAGRSTPTDGSALTEDDLEGVHCDFCHKLVNPELAGNNPYADDDYYMQETFGRDTTYLSSLTDVPPAFANGMFVVDSDNSKRGPFSDANAKHQRFYSPFHKEAELCGTCHDVSNPAFDRVVVENGPDYYVPNEFGVQAPNFNPYTMFPVERTYSEWKMSAYNSEEGIPSEVFGGNKANVATCQDCHMQDVTGYGCNKSGVPLRSDLPLHDMTGGNTFIPGLVAQLYPGAVDTAALHAGVNRAKYMLQHAATLEVVSFNGEQAVVKVTNETGHKLPSGYPEGRRIWLNVKGYDDEDVLAYESGRYDFDAAEIVKTDVDGVLVDSHPKIYEIKPGISESLASVVGLPAGPSFHFVLNNEIFSDNRIPPRGFTNAGFEMIQSPPVNYTYADGQYWDETTYDLPDGVVRIEATLYYQTLSNEYVTYLRDENTTNDAGNILYSLWENNGKSAPEVMTTASASYQPLCYSIELEEGWNILSLPYRPANLNAEEIFEYLMEDSTLVKVQDEDGNSLEDWGEFGDWQNNIGLLGLTEGYKIKMNHADSVAICGQTVTYPFPIPLNPGWNIIGFPHAQACDGMEVIRQLIDHGILLKVQNEQGYSIENLGIYGGWQNFIGNFFAGKGFKVKVADVDTLWIFETYPKAAAAPKPEPESKHFSKAYTGNGINHMNFNLVNLAADRLNAGDEIAIYDQNTCVGAAVITAEILSNGLVSIPASAADGAGMPGFTAGNPYRIYIWKAGQNEVVEVETTHITGPEYFTEYESVVLSLENELLTVSEEIKENGITQVKCYPNPFSDQITIELSLNSNAELKVEVLNQLGQRVKTIATEQQLNTGIHRLIWDGTSASGSRVSHGIYYLRIGVNDQLMHKKVIVSKEFH